MRITSHLYGAPSSLVKQEWKGGAGGIPFQNCCRLFHFAHALKFFGQSFATSTHSRPQNITCGRKNLRTTIKKIKIKVKIKKALKLCPAPFALQLFKVWLVTVSKFCWRRKMGQWPLVCGSQNNVKSHASTP